MPIPPKLNPGEPVLSSQYNALVDVTVPSFANAASRDQYLPAATAPLGSMCVTLDNGAVWELNDRSGSRRWTPPWNVPWGFVGGLTSSTVLSGIAGVTNIPGLDITLTHPPNRRVQIRMAQQGVAQTVAGAGAQLFALQDSTQVHSTAVLLAATNIGVTINLLKDVNTTAASHRYLAQISNFGGGALTINTAGQFLGASHLVVYDVGPAVNIPVP
jgi:hypothetical protein